MFGMWDVEDMGCSGCGMLGMWDVRYVGCLGCGMFRMWNVRDVGCSGCKMFGMWDVRDVGCSGYGMYAVWDVRDVGSRMFTGMWDVDLQNAVENSMYTCHNPIAIKYLTRVTHRLDSVTFLTTNLRMVF